MGEIGEADSHNLFAYCLNNPVMLLDSAGLFPEGFGKNVAYAMVLWGLAAAVENGLNGVTALSMAAIIASAAITAGVIKESSIFISGTAVNGPPNSLIKVSRDVWRVFDKDGRADFDIDFGNEHPEFKKPHYHKWSWKNGVPKRGKAYGDPAKDYLYSPEQNEANLFISIWIVILAYFTGYQGTEDNRVPVLA